MEEINSKMSEMKIEEKLNSICNGCYKSITKNLCFCDNLPLYEENIESIIKIQKIWRNYLVKANSTSLELDLIIKNNNYIKNCKSNKNKDIDSLSYLISRELSQSDCIKMGNGLEKIFYDIVLYHTKLKDIKPKNKKGKKEKDHLWCDEDNKIIYYAEFKSNINLDTEKSKSTYEKCQNIVIELKKKFPEYDIKWCLVCCRYINNINIPNKLKYKYNTIKNNLFGVNEYLSLLNINLSFTFSRYCNFLNKIADEMFE
jgi:hypothetical protein